MAVEPRRRPDGEIRRSDRASHSRLSIDRCRRLLERPTDISDAEIELLRDQLYAIAGALLEDYARRPCRDGELKRLPGRDFERALEELPPEERTHVEERAAILEYDGRLERDVAQRKSIADWLTFRR